MATSKAPPAPARATASTAVKMPAMKTAPLIVKSTAPAPVGAPPGASASPGGAVARQTMVIAFVDLARFQIASKRVKDDVLAELLDDYYERIADGVKTAGGRVVKYMGDGALVVFPIDRASQAARSLLLLKSGLDARLAQRGFLSKVVIGVHAGEVMAGPFGAKGEKRFDVIGHAVNRAAAVKGDGGLALSADAYSTLDAKTQKLFKARGGSYVPA